MQEWFLAGVIVFFASTLQAVTGFGFAITATPFLLLVYNSRDSIQISIFLSFFIALILLPRIRDNIDYSLFRRLAIGSLLGVPLGLWIYEYISLDSLKIMVSVVVLAVTCFLLYSQYRSRLSRYPAERKMPNAVHELLAGFCSGILTASIGLPGVPLALYFSANNTDKRVVRSTTLAFFGVVYIATILAQAVTANIESGAIYSSLLLAPIAAVGVLCGHYIFPRVRQNVFQVITNIVLLYTAVYMLFKV